MKIIHRYILGITIRNLLLSLMVFVLLFLVIDFFERIDNILEEDASWLSTMEYFLCKLPLIITRMLPIAMLMSSMLTFGLLSKNSEVIAMRASGMKILWLARPVFGVALVLSLFSILLSETLVPYATRREKEIYNLDIKQKDKRGGYSQENFWWRTDDKFYSVNMFDSRSSSLLGLSILNMDSNFRIEKRVDAERVKWIDGVLGWSMNAVSEYQFPLAEPGKKSASAGVSVKNYNSLPLPIGEKPENFFDVRAEPEAMSYRQLRKFIRKQSANGIPIKSYLVDMQAKLSYPFVTFFVTLAVLPFAIRPARSGSLAVSFMAAVIIGFTYYAVHSFSLALGRAELWHPVLGAWMANILLALVGTVLNLGSEAP